MKVLVTLSLFLFTAFLLGSSFWLALNDKGVWPWFLGVGVFSFLVSAAVGAGLATEKNEDDEEDDVIETGD